MEVLICKGETREKVRESRAGGYGTRCWEERYLNEGGALHTRSIDWLLKQAKQKLQKLS
ncbi:unnamed protein product [Sphenostylis stenocarpa]|uniref:Uncharacterized protein n=1 Tax=Sphenostylis stenocarpa TaxID=92480 RepID=A0AA86SED9_9FABA|nr:unnamed protein product [Sphenostylis stenocarpa]